MKCSAANRLHFPSHRNGFGILLAVLVVVLIQSGCVSLSGNLLASSKNLSFGNVAIGSSSHQSVTLTNSGTGALTLTQAVASGRGFTVKGPPLPLTLAGGQSATFTTTFVPTAVGSASGSLSIAKTQLTTPRASTASVPMAPVVTTQTESIPMSGVGVPVTPSITSQPTSQTVAAGQTATFSVTASGADPLSYQWSKNGTAISGATSTTYTTPTTATTDSGSQFSVVVSNSTGSVTSNTATLTVNAASLTINVSPNNATVKLGSTQQFAGIVTGSSKTAVTWTVGGGGCTGAACGTISNAGLYIPPSSVPSPATVTVTATSVADPTKSASANVAIVAALAVLLSLSPTSASVPTSGTQLFTASVTGTSNTAVTWSVSGAACSGSSCGTISTSASSAVYLAPSVAPSPASVTVVATSVADPTKTASASLTVVPGAAVTVSPTNASVPTGTTQQFKASVTGTSNTAVAWSVTGAGCSGAACGTINISGLYTAPAVAPSSATVTITATSVADPAKSGAANLTIVGSAKAGPASLTLPTLPQATVGLTMPTQTGTVRNVPAGNATALQTAINSSTCGDTIVLVAGSTYSGNFTIPNKVCSGWILIQSSALSSLPVSNHRVGPSNVSNMATVSTPNTSSAFQFYPSSHNWRLMGLEITTSYVSTSNVVYNLASTGYQTDNSTSLTVRNQLPSYIIFDRDYIHGLPNTNSTQGVILNGLSLAVVDSYCDEIHANGNDSQCFLATNAAGPLLIQNNFIQAAGENIMFGGADPAITNGIPSDITIVGNLFQKNLIWKGQAAPYNWVVKNHFELKNAQRVLLDGNVLQYTWAAGQYESIILRAVNQDGACTWCVVQDVTVTHNLIQHAPMGIQITGPNTPYASLGTSKLLLQNNLLDDISAVKWGNPGRAFAVGPGSPAAHDITIDHNTSFPDQMFLYLGDTGTVSSTQFTNNISDYGVYGIFGNGGYTGTAALNTFAPGYIYNDTTLLTSDGNPIGMYPSGVFWNTTSGAGFTNYSGANYQLTSGSPYHNAGMDGKDIGVWDWITFNTKTTNALNGAF